MPTTVCWYSSDSKLERRVVLPASAYLLAIGQEAALFRVGGKPELATLVRSQARGTASH